MTLSASKPQSPERFMRMDVFMVSFHLCTFDQSSDGWKIYGVDGKKGVFDSLQNSHCRSERLHATDAYIFIQSDLDFIIELVLPLTDKDSFKVKLHECSVTLQ